jgi:hypothetical protein
MIKNASAAESKYRFTSARNPYSHRNGKAILFTGIRSKSVGYFAAVRLRDGKFLFRREIEDSMEKASGSS